MYQIPFKKLISIVVMLIFLSSDFAIGATSLSLPQNKKSITQQNEVKATLRPPLQGAPRVKGLIDSRDENSEVVDGLVYMPKKHFVMYENILDQMKKDPDLIKPTRSAGEARKLLKEKGSLTIIGAVREFDGPGSSLDLPYFQLELTGKGAKSVEQFPAIATIASNFTATIRFEDLDDPDVIEYVAPDYGITQDNPLRVKGEVALDKNGHIAQKYAPMFVFRNLFGLSGIRITCEGISPMALAGGMESSNVFNTALVMAGSMLSGAGLSQADCVSLAVKLENLEYAGLTGGQGHYCTLLGGASQHVFLSGEKDAEGNLVNTYGTLSIPFLTSEDQFKAFEDHFLLVQAGKEYKDGEATGRSELRAATLTNWMWTDLLTHSDVIGRPLHEEKMGLTADYIKAIKEGDWDTVYRTMNRYVDIRDDLCKRWLHLAIAAKKRIEAGLPQVATKDIPEYAYEFAKKAFTDPENKDYGSYKLVRDMYYGNRDMGIPALGDELEHTSLYTLDPIITLVKAARKENIALFPLGAGGPGTNIGAVSPLGKEHIKKFLESHGIGELTEEKALEVMHGTGVLKGYMEARIYREPLKIIGADKLGLELPEGPQRIKIAKGDITKPAREEAIVIAKRAKTLGLPLEGFIANHSGEFATVKEIVKGLSEVGIPANDVTVAMALGDLEKTGRIAKGDDGKYYWKVGNVVAVAEPPDHKVEWQSTDDGKNLPGSDEAKAEYELAATGGIDLVGLVKAAQKGNEGAKSQLQAFKDNPTPELTEALNAKTLPIFATQVLQNEAGFKEALPRLLGEYIVVIWTVDDDQNNRITANFGDMPGVIVLPLEGKALVAALDLMTDPNKELSTTMQGFKFYDMRVLDKSDKYKALYKAIAGQV